MKKQDKDKLKQATPAELETKLRQLKDQLVLTTQKIKLGKEENLKAAKNIRYEIALIKTYLNQIKLQEK